MIDVWMIVTMLYPFAVVTLYTLREVTRKKKEKLGNGKIELKVKVKLYLGHPGKARGCSINRVSIK